MTLIAFCILFVCKVSVGLKGRRETMRRTSRRTFKLEQRPERPWAISWLPDLQVRAHDKAQLRCVPASVFSFPFSCFASGVGKRTQPENNRPYLFCCFVTSLKSHDCLLQNSPFPNWSFLRSFFKMSTKEAFSWEQRLVCDENGVLSEKCLYSVRRF